MANRRNKIWVGPADGANAKPLIVEGLAVDAFTPGELIVRDASGLNTSTNASTVLGQECLIAREIGANIGGDVDTAATVGETAYAVKLRSGEFALVRSAATQNITAKGLALTSNGDGTFKLAGAADDKIVYSEEIINVTAAGTLVLVSRA
ncbi:hypothetical protein N9980_00585 [bacterium]|nr:hypothetical protein [bacterium]